MPDPVSRLQLAQAEIDKTFGSNYAREHPEVVSAVMMRRARLGGDDDRGRAGGRGRGGAAQRWRPGAGASSGAAMRRLSIDVSFDERAGYVVSHPGLPPLSALSLSGLRRRIGEALRPETAEIKFVLDKVARRERDARRGTARASDYMRG